MSIRFVHTFLSARRKLFPWRKSHLSPIQGFHRLLMIQPTSRTEPLELAHICGKLKPTIKYVVSTMWDGTVLAFHSTGWI